MKRTADITVVVRGEVVAAPRLHPLFELRLERGIVDGEADDVEAEAEPVVQRLDDCLISASQVSLPSAAIRSIVCTMPEHRGGIVRLWN